MINSVVTNRGEGFELWTVELQYSWLELVSLFLMNSIVTNGEGDLNSGRLHWKHNEVSVELQGSWLELVSLLTSWLVLCLL